MFHIQKRKPGFPKLKSRCFFIRFSVLLILFFSTYLLEQCAFGQGLVGAPVDHHWGGSENGPVIEEKEVDHLMVFSSWFFACTFIFVQCICKKNTANWLLISQMQLLYLAFLASVAVPKVSQSYSDTLTAFVSSTSQTRSEQFIKNIMLSTAQNNTTLLWSTYPASVRGRVFGGDSSNVSSVFDQTGPYPQESQGGGGW